MLSCQINNVCQFNLFYLYLMSFFCFKTFLLHNCVIEEIWESCQWSENANKQIKRSNFWFATCGKVLFLSLSFRKSCLTDINCLQLLAVKKVRGWVFHFCSKLIRWQEQCCKTHWCVMLHHWWCSPAVHMSPKTCESWTVLKNNHRNLS